MSEQELRELDAQVHREVMGKFCEQEVVGPPPEWLHYCEYGMHGIPSYSTDIAAAWLVVDEVYRQTSLMVAVIRVAWDKWGCRFGNTVSKDHPTAPIAICKTALKRLREKGISASGAQS